MFKKPAKFDMSFLDYLTSKDVECKIVSIEEIQRRYPFVARHNMECHKLYLSLNEQYLSEQQKRDVRSIIQLYNEQEKQKFINAIKYIEQCQLLQQE
jgi:hypothetical protein